MKSPSVAARVWPLVSVRKWIIDRTLTNAATTWLCGVLCFVGAAQGLAASVGEEVAGLAASFSGHIAVLTAPGAGELSASAVGRTLAEAGLAPHVLELTPRQFADTNFFTARRFPVALYLGFESYFQSVQRPNDGDAALRHYLAGGGTLLLLPAGPFPLFYNEKNKPANGAAVIGLNINAGGFEQAPPGLNLIFHVNTSQSVLRGFPERFPFPSPLEADQRWRPSRKPPSADVRYTPLVTLLDQRGGNHGEGVATLEFIQGPWRGGRVLYVWLSLLARHQNRLQIVRDALRWALAGRSAPQTTLLRDDFEARSDVLGGDAVWDLQTGSWKIESGALVGENCISDRYDTKGAQRGNCAWRDYVLSLRFKVESRGGDWRDGPWFGVRCRPDGDGYYLTFTDRDCQLHKMVYGVSTSDANPLIRAPFKPDNQWHTLRVEARANHLKALLDGQPLFEVKDDAYLSLPSLRSGGIVLAARKGTAAQRKTVVRFDDVQVKLLEELHEK